MTPESERMQLLDLEDVAWPITIRFEVEASYGRSRQELTVDAPALQGALGPSWKLGEELWRRGVAPATSAEAELVGYDTVLWRYAAAGIPTPVTFAPGNLGGATSARSQQGCLVLHTGHVDRRARRRFYLPAVPASWHSDGLMDQSGLRALDAAAKLMFMGFNGELFGGPFKWLIAYPDELTPSQLNPRGVGFRRVQYVRSCWHTAKAPDLTASPWP